MTVLTKKQKKAAAIKLVETKIKEYIVNDVVEYGRKYFNDDVEVSLRWRLLACEVWIKVGDNDKVLISVLFSNNWFKIEPEFKSKGFGIMLHKIYDAYNFIPIDYKEYGLARKTQTIPS